MVLQQMAVVQAAAGSADASDPDAAEVARLAALLPPDETQLLYSICLHGRAELGLAPDEYAGLTMVLLRLLAFKPGAMTAGGSGGGAEKKTLKPAEAAPRPQPRVAAAPSSPSAPTPPARPAPPAPLAPPEAARLITTTPAQRPNITESAQRPSAQPVAEPRPGQRLPVVEEGQPQRAVPASQAASAPQPVPVPVRAVPEPRQDSRADVPVAAAAAPLVLTEEGDFWHGVVKQLDETRAVTALARELALQSQLVARDADEWLLRVERESLNSTGSRERLQAALQAAGHAVKLTVEVGRVIDSPARRNAAAAAERQQAAEELIRNDPFVQAMMRKYDATIVPGSIKPL